MKKTIVQRFLIFILLLALLANFARAQPTTWGRPPPQQPYATFTPSLAIIVAVLVAALFFMGFFSVYVRHCGETAGGGGAVAIRRAISLRNRRASAARGLDAEVIETFPTFTYAEVKDHHIGKGALECAVCLNEFEEEETLRLIPKCDHVFHPECIDAWLESHVTCPVCRANLVPQLDEEPVFNVPVENNADSVHSSMERSDSRNEQVVINVTTSEPEPVQVPKMERGGSLEYVNGHQRSWSMSMFGFGKFRSHSTGHSLVQPGENLERYTLRLPVQVRKDMMNRASLSRIGSYATTLPRERSSKSGFRGDGSGRTSKSYRKVDREAKSDRWVFFTRALSMKSPTGQGSSNESRNPVKMPSFKCLEPKTSNSDEAGLIAGDQLAKSSV